MTLSLNAIKSRVGLGTQDLLIQNHHRDDFYRNDDRPEERKVFLIEDDRFEAYLQYFTGVSSRLWINSNVNALVNGVLLFLVLFYSVSPQGFQNYTLGGTTLFVSRST